eukprot:gene22630-30907_t
MGGRSKKRITQFMYPVEFLSPVIGTTFSISNLSSDSLYCFGNRDYKSPAFTDALFCMFIIPLYSQIVPQQSLPHYMPLYMRSWISSKSKYLFSHRRPVVVDVNGSVELLKLHKLPPESSTLAERVGAPIIRTARIHTPVNATRWMHVSDSREVRHIPAEPIHICARSDDWEGLNSSMLITFRSAHIREKDRQLSLQKLFIHILLLSAVSSKNRFLYRLYLSYFFTRHEETKVIIRQRTPLFQALFFSSALMCIGTASSYAVYYYFGSVVDREIRNALLKLTISMAVSWFTFFLCRSFERFCRDWAMSVGLAQMLDHHLNPLCRTNVIVATIILSQVVKFSVPKFVRISRLDTLVKLCLPKLQAILLSYGSHLHKRYHHYRYRSHHHVHTGPSLSGNTADAESAAATIHKTPSLASLKANSSSGHLGPTRRRGSHGNPVNVSPTVDTQPLAHRDSRDGNENQVRIGDDGCLLWESTQEEFYEERNQKAAAPKRRRHSKDSASIADVKVFDSEKDLKISESTAGGGGSHEGEEDLQFDVYGETAIDEAGLEGLFYEDSSDGDDDSDDEEDDDGDDDGVIDELRDFEEENPADFSFYSTASSNSPLRPSRRQKKSHLFYSGPTAAAKAKRAHTIPRSQTGTEDTPGECKAPLWRILQNWERTQLSVYSPSPEECNSGGGSNDRELSPTAKIADMSELYGDKSTEFKNRMAFMRFEGINLSALISNEQIIRTIELYKKILRLPIESAKIIGGSNSSRSVYQKADSASSDFPAVDNTITTRNVSMDLEESDSKSGPLDHAELSIPEADLPKAVSNEDLPEEPPSHILPATPPPTLPLPPDSMEGKGQGDDSTNAPQSTNTPQQKMSLTINVDNTHNKMGGVRVLDIDGIHDIYNPDPQKDFFPYNQFSNIVGALTLPLSLVGPLKFSFLVKSYRFQRDEKCVIALNEEMEKHRNRIEKRVDTYAWLPLATLDKNIVDSLQLAVNCLNDVSQLPGRKRRESILGAMMVSKLYPPIRRKAFVSVRVVFDSCDHAAAFHSLSVQQRQSLKGGSSDEREEKDELLKEHEDSISISVIDGISTILEENVVLLQLSLATSMTSYVSEDSLIYRYCDFPSSQPIEVACSEDFNNSGILLAGNYSLQHLLDKGRQILLRYIERIRTMSTKSKSVGLSSMKMNFFDESNPSSSFSTPDGYRSAPVMGFRNHCSHYVSTTVSISSRVAGLLGFANNELLLQASEHSLLYDRALIDKYLHRILCALFTALNIDVSLIPNILANFQICHSLVVCEGEGKEGGQGDDNDAATTQEEAGQRSVRVGEHQRLDLCLFIPLMFGDREAMSSLRTDTAAPDTNTELCLDLLLGNVYSDIGDQVLFPVADDDATSDLNDSDHSTQEQGPKCKYLPDSDSIFGRTISGSILLAYLAYLQKSYPRR